MKYRFYITTGGERIYGTNDEDRAQELRESDVCYVIDTERNVWLDATEEIPIEELPE